MEWENNKESLLSFIEATHMGVKGMIEHSCSFWEYFYWFANFKRRQFMYELLSLQEI
jgi:hypothetical protein